MSLKTQGIALRLAVMGSLLIGATAFAAPLLNQPTRDYTYILRRNFGYSHNCEFTTEFRAIPACRNSSKAETMVWGDSYAMHLIPGMTADRANATVIQATRSTCAPVLDIAFTDMSAYNQEWAEECIRFNDSVLKYLSKAPSVSVVVLGSIYRQLVKSGNFVVVRRDDGKLLRIDATVKEATTRLLGTIRAIRAMGKRVVVVSPPPYASYDVGRCLERIERGLPVIGVSTRCYIMLTNSDAELQGVAALMDALADTGEIGILDLPSILCESGRCRTAADGVFLYRDKGHFSVEGSIHLFRSYGLASKVNMLAR